MDDLIRRIQACVAEIDAAEAGNGGWGPHYALVAPSLAERLEAWLANAPSKTYSP